MPTLTPKQEAFAIAYVETSNATEAYRRAYNTEKAKPESLWRQAKAVLDNVKVASRIEELQAQHRKTHSVTVASLTEDARKLYKMAHNAGQVGPATQALTLIARLHGLLIDKREHSGTVQVTASVRSRIPVDEITSHAEKRGRILEGEVVKTKSIAAPVPPVPRTRH